MKTLTLVAALLVLGACSQFFSESQGVGFGSGEDDYKESPCACLEIPQKFKRFYKG